MNPELLSHSYVAPRLAGYGAPVLANVPVVQFSEGDFSYNGLRGLGQSSSDSAGGPPTAPAPGISVNIPISWIFAAGLAWVFFREFDIAKFKK